MRQTRSSPCAISCRPFPGRKSEIGSCAGAVALCCCAGLLLGVCLAGCSAESSGIGAPRQQAFSQDELSIPYNHVMLKKSLTIDALPKIQRFESDLGPLLGGIEVFSQGDSVAASVGQSEDGRETWFNMVAFDEFELNVVRKYFFLVDEHVGRFPTRTRPGLRFNCEMVVDEDVLGKSYASENARRIATLAHIRENLHKDMGELSAGGDLPNQDNKMLSVCGMLVNQTLEMILVKLDSSPVLATRLSEGDGVDFDHINFGGGKVLMAFMDDMVGLRICFGAFGDAGASHR